MIFTFLFFLLSIWIGCAVDHPDDYDHVVSARDFEKRFREAMNYLHVIPDEREKHFIFIVDVSGSMIRVCDQIGPTVSLVLDHMSEVPDMKFSILLFGSFEVLFDHVTYSEAMSKLASHRFTCTTGTPMKTAFDMSRERFIKPNEFTIAMLVTDGQSTEGIQATREAAEHFKRELGVIGTDTLGLFAVGLGDAAQAELMTMCSSPGHYTLYSEIGVFFKIFKSSLKSYQLEREAKNNVIVLDLTDVTTDVVNNTADEVPIHITFTVTDAPKDYKAKDFIEIQLKELQMSGKPPFFLTNNQIQKAYLVDSDGQVIQYQYDGVLIPKYKNNAQNALGVPYEIEISTTEKNFIFERNIIEFSVSVYAGYFDFGMNILPLGAGEVGKSLWVFTGHVSHSRDKNWAEVADVVTYGRTGDGRTLDVSLFRMSDRGDNYFGNPHSYYDIFGMELYDLEFLKLLFKGWIPKGYHKNEYNLKTYLQINGPPLDPDLKLPPVDAVAFFIKSESLDNKVSMEKILENLKFIKEADPDMPIVIIVSCHDTYQCEDEVLTDTRTAIFKECEKCPINDLNPYIYFEETGQNKTAMLKSSKIDKNQWAINENLQISVKRVRRKKTEDFCSLSTLNKDLCKLKREKGRKIGLTEDEIAMCIKLEYRVEEHVLDCIHDYEGCIREYDDWKYLQYLINNPIISEYPSWMNLKVVGGGEGKGEDNHSTNLFLDPKVQIENDKKKEDFLRDCSKNEEKCQEMFDLYQKTKDYCNEDEVMKEMCLFLESKEDQDAIEYRNTYNDMTDTPIKCYNWSIHKDHDDFCLSWFEIYTISKYCEEEENEFDCKCMFESPTNQEITNHVMNGRRRRTKHSRMIEHIFDISDNNNNNNKWLLKCKKETEEEYCVENDRICKCVEREFGKESKFICAIAKEGSDELLACQECEFTGIIIENTHIFIFLSTLIFGFGSVVIFYFYFFFKKKKKKPEDNEDENNTDNMNEDDDDNKKKKKEEDINLENEKEEGEQSSSLSLSMKKNREDRESGDDDEEHHVKEEDKKEQKVQVEEEKKDIGKDGDDDEKDGKVEHVDNDGKDEKKEE